jgi:transcriptional regulator with XRE-family HTH domain
VDFGTRAKMLRENAKMTQDQLAKQLGVSDSMISFYELRERAPSPDILIKYAQTFHVTTDYLLGLEYAQVLNVGDLDEHEVLALETVANSFRKKKKHL